jgi:hypothetical protein
LRLGNNLIDEDLKSPTSEDEDDETTTTTHAITKIQARWRAFLS